MHKLVGILTCAETEDQAKEQALAFADELVERDEFDSYDIDSDRWEEGGQTYQLSSEAGRLALQAALRANRRAFDWALYAVRMILAHYTDEQIYQDEFPDEPRDYWASRYQFAVVGGYTHDCYLYGEDEIWGGKVQNDNDYAMATRDLDPNDLWITNLDFHH
jgi:hypothetical protein